MARLAGFSRGQLRCLHGAAADDSPRAGPVRPVFVYGDLFGVSLRSSDFPEQGFAKANGGSHDAIHPFSISQIGLNGVLQRTEDHWPGKWTGYFPEVLDASVFAMSYGGGLGMNCKHYLFTYQPELGKDRLLKFDDLRKPPYSLDRFEKFMRSGSAMRPADRMPGRDPGAARYRGRTPDQQRSIERPLGRRGAVGMLSRTDQLRCRGISGRRQGAPHAYDQEPSLAL